MPASSTDTGQADQIERPEHAHDQSPLTPDEVAALTAKLEFLMRNAKSLDPRLARQLIHMAGPDYVPQKPSDPYAQDMSKSGMHPQALVQIEKRADEFVTGIALDNDLLVGMLLRTFAAVLGVSLAELRSVAVTNVGGKSFVCGAAADELGSAVSILCFQRHERHVLVLSDQPGGDDLTPVELIAAAETLRERVAAGGVVHTQAARDYYRSLATLLAVGQGVLLRWRFDEVAVSILRGSKAPIDQVPCGVVGAPWRRVWSRSSRGMTGPTDVDVYADGHCPLSIRFGSHHVRFRIRFGGGTNFEYDEEACELPILALLGARAEGGLHARGFAVSSLQPQLAGDARAGVDVAGDGLAKRRGAWAAAAWAAHSDPDGTPTAPQQQMIDAYYAAVGRRQAQNPTRLAQTQRMLHEADGKAEAAQTQRSAREEKKRARQSAAGSR